MIKKPNFTYNLYILMIHDLVINFSLSNRFSVSLYMYKFYSMRNEKTCMCVYIQYENVSQDSSQLPMYFSRTKIT